MIETIGCQMNICESEALSKIFLDKGLTQV
ncbi:MAG: hypothetical protein LBV66_00570, partial [Elusimicrobiota bacterium]|nr:hypothetical protein [Elusimicrobiota bacterium]